MGFDTNILPFNENWQREKHWGTNGHAAFKAAPATEQYHTEYAESLNFSLNGSKISIPAGEVDPSMSLNDYIRRHTSFTGTKRSCGQGFCSACCVNLSTWRDGQVVSIGVNSCVVKLASIDGASIITTEGLGNSRDGWPHCCRPRMVNLDTFSCGACRYHPIQERVVGYNGSQCGYCTPGMVMAMYSRVQGHFNAILTPF